MLLRCSSMARAMYSGNFMRKRPVHELVTLLVCCPANNIAIIMPASSSTLSLRPSLYFWSIKDCRASSCGTSGFALRSLTMEEKSSHIFRRAASRRRCAGVGASRQNMVIVVSPSSRHWNSLATSPDRRSRISSPMSARLAVRIISSASSSRRSTVPLSPYLLKKSWASNTMGDTYDTIFSLRSATRRNLSCCWRTSSGTS
mmetsp:Transcript_22439/g.63019  ORF Transcript_22439/g.63019 Transcript_22439/m.63019 type:complete len:201 (+) Transcript_22439:782-1384(+)